MQLDLKHIKQIRKEIGMTQKQLAQHSGVSQSLIAKIESGRLDPSYTNAKKIIDTLQQTMQQKAIKAQDIMKKKIIAVSKKATATQAIALMRKYNVSQLPVLDNDQVVGLITERALLEAWANNNPQAKIQNLMLSPPPLVPADAPLQMVKDLLQYWPIVLIEKEKKVVGIIAKSDVLAALIKHHKA
ncbi:MAG: CBS domain-containing protein [Candidatus Woesearchaeota archaeon]